VRRRLLLIIALKAQKAIRSTGTQRAITTDSVCLSACLSVWCVCIGPEQNTCASSKLVKKTDKEDAGFFYKFFYLSRQDSKAKLH